MTRPFSAAILAGGRSQRMGTDKAFLDIEGQPMVVRLATRLRDAGATEIVAVGGDADRLAAAGLGVVPDDHPGDGPLGGVLTALGAADGSLVFVIACDHPDLDPELPARLVAEWDEGVDAVVPVAGGSLQVLAALYHRGAAAALGARFSLGERSVQRALTDVAVREVHDVGPASFLDLDTPADVGHYALGHAHRTPGDDAPDDR